MKINRRNDYNIAFILQLYATCITPPFIISCYPPCTFRFFGFLSGFNSFRDLFWGFILPEWPPPSFPKRYPSRWKLVGKGYARPLNTRFSIRRWKNELIIKLKRVFYIQNQACLAGGKRRNHLLHNSWFDLRIWQKVISVLPYNGVKHIIGLNEVQSSQTWK